jgi:hypothetical protein
MVEVAGVEPACLLVSQGASTCLACSLLSSLKRKEAYSLISMPSKYDFSVKANTKAMPASRRLYPLAGVWVETLLNYAARANCSSPINFCNGLIRSLHYLRHAATGYSKRSNPVHPQKMEIRVTVATQLKSFQRTDCIVKIKIQKMTTDKIDFYHN